MKFTESMLKFYCVTDRQWLNNMTLSQGVEEAIKGGVTIVQLREKNLEYKEFLQEAILLKEVCSKYNIPFIVNDNLQVAIDSNADGLHIGQEDLKNMSICEIREKLGENKIIGVTAKTTEQAINAEKQGADYLGSGAIFGSTTKSEAKPMSVETFTNICNCVNIPVCAIGGLNEVNMIELTNSNLKGVAMVSAIFNSTDIKKKSTEISEKLDKLIKY